MAMLTGKLALISRSPASRSRVMSRSRTMHLSQNLKTTFVTTKAA